jgi:hypothetical protein
MPKNNKRGKRQAAGAQAAQTTDDDFDDMLAEVMAADTTSTTITSSSSRTFSSSSDPTATARATTRATQKSIAEVAIAQCCAAGDIDQLRRWARQGVRVASAVPLCVAAQLGKVDILRILIKELGADANNAVAGSNDPTQNGTTPWLRCDAS